VYILAKVNTRHVDWLFPSLVRFSPLLLFFLEKIIPVAQGQGKEVKNGLWLSIK
jgi:hypothetical protein